MTDHSITPPPELVQQWREQGPAGIFDGYKYPEREKALCLVAAQWGADQELDACCKWLDKEIGPVDSCDLRADRRPKPPTDKELAIRELGDAYDKGKIDDTTYYTILRALRVQIS